MTEPAASLPPANVPAKHAWRAYAPAYDGEPDTPEISFRELWSDPEKGMTFADFLDVINPLQHIPVVSTIYRMVTGDTISNGARMAGDVLFGGPTSLIASGITAAFEETTGNSVEGHIAALFGDDQSAPETTPELVASAAQPPAAAVPKPPADGGQRSMSPVAESPSAEALFRARRPAMNRAVPPTAGGETLTPGPVRTIPVPAPAVDRPPGAADIAKSAAADERTAERQRIAETLARARSQQAALLLASVAPASGAGTDDADDKDAAKQQTGAAAPTPAAASPHPGDPFRSHPFMLPPGASPEMISRAMEQALEKYHRGLQARGAGR